MLKYFVLVFTILFVSPSFAVEPDEILDDPVLETRARDISVNVRCVVCQNEPIDTSNAGVARDLRLLIRERLVAGDSNDQVYEFLVARYGDYVLFKPPWRPSTYLLWLAPFLILGGGIIGMVYTLSRKPQKPRDGLSADEQATLDNLIGSNSEKDAS
ncbi:cytochrome c-type biogenesis protein CcmH [Amylibacter ulvae]|uniref:Cytochrome c-type biogenesis protein n=1 Tax=Paramylibacter ulvae TaxID=1651968 RepID=A0ABQ3D0V3_9RHOB|nr:cytochrome c-type biogenesis protein [Amylibacter ulvae]GHA50510.1 cytochrome c-type biogenesis protein CcmH [Amylibacter ulvae]